MGFTKHLAKLVCSHLLRLPLNPISTATEEPSGRRQISCLLPQPWRKPHHTLLLCGPPREWQSTCRCGSFGGGKFPNFLDPNSSASNLLLRWSTSWQMLPPSLSLLHATCCWRNVGVSSLMSSLENLLVLGLQNKTTKHGRFLLCLFQRAGERENKSLFGPSRNNHVCYASWPMHISSPWGFSISMQPCSQGLCHWLGEGTDETDAVVVPWERWPLTTSKIGLVVPVSCPKNHTF